MIKFFRRIRQQLLAENKFTKYLVYAAGEIILVVIGILIALYINDQNTIQLNREKEEQYILDIRRDLARQIEAIDKQLEIEDKIIENCDIVLSSFLEKNTLVIDTALARSIGITTVRRTFRNTNPAYQELISSGNIVLLSDKEFKERLVNYYFELERTEEIITNNNDRLTDQVYLKSILELVPHDQRETFKIVFKEYPRQYDVSDPLSVENRNKLLEISSKILQDDSKQMHLINLLTTRKTVAFSHAFLLMEFKQQTKEMIRSTDAYYDSKLPSAETK